MEVQTATLARDVSSAAVKKEQPLRIAITELHTQIPLVALARWHENLRQSMQTFTRDGEITSASGCTGSNIFVKVFQMLLPYWHETYDMPAAKLVDELVAEIEPAKPDFLRTHFDRKVMVGNVEDFKLNIVHNLMDDSYIHLP